MVEIFWNTSGPIDTAVTNGKTALVAQQLLANITSNFMVKNIRTIVHATWPAASDPLALLLGDDDAVIQDIEDALVPDTSRTRENGVGYPLGQTLARRIWGAIEALYEGRLSDGDSTTMVIDWKLPPKGIPVLKGRGLSIYGFNMSTSQFADGPTLFLITKIMGGWF